LAIRHLSFFPMLDFEASAPEVHLGGARSAFRYTVSQVAELVLF
jgi:hypothetical protein